MKIFGIGKEVFAWKGSNIWDGDLVKIGFALRGGNICDPLNGQWFGPTFPTRVWRAYCPLPILPFLSCRVGRFGFYIGFKLYRVDVDAYHSWMPKEDIYPDSRALCLSARATTSGGK